MQNDEDWLFSGFGEVYPAHVSAFVDLMLELRRAFDGDLDAMLILAIIGDQRVWKRAASQDVSYALRGETPLANSEKVASNILSIASYSGIPRETVRRKVNALIDRGWIDREENGDLRPTRKAATDLQHGTEATIAYIREIVEVSDRVRRA